MKIEILRKCHESRRLILILAGWGSDGRLYEEIAARAPHGWEIACVSGFDGTPAEGLTDGYDTVYLYAWSLGVAAAAELLEGKQPTRAIAVNGTPLPADDSYGIPEAIYEGTRAALDPRNLKKFRRRMCSGTQQYREIDSRLEQNPDIKKLQEELSYIRETSRRREGASISWDRVYIGNTDAIIPAANQRRYWESHLPAEGIVELDEPHYIDLGQIVAETLPDPMTVGSRFREAMEAYRPNATVQLQIAERLANRLKESLDKVVIPPGKELELLEIGPGCGLFTELWKEFLRPAKATYVDLYPLKKFDGAKDEEYIVGDASEWIEQSESNYDFIVSASAIQWMADPLRFLRRAAAKLKNGGIMAISSFLPGNLQELDSLRPSPLPYKSREEIEATLKDCGLQTVTEEALLSIEFSTLRDALMHLKHTGVTGVGSSGSSICQLRRALTGEDGKIRLTYRPVWAIAQKKYNPQ